MNDAVIKKEIAIQTATNNLFKAAQKIINDAQCKNIPGVASLRTAVAEYSIAMMKK